MITATVTWDLPTTRKDGTPLDPSQISAVTITDSQNPTGTVTLPGTATTFTTGDLTSQPGEHDFSVIVIDTSSPPLSSVAAVGSGIVPVVTPVLAAPSPVTSVAVTINQS